MGYYIDQFREAVRNAHDPSGETCHWTVRDIKDSHEKGPCDCPSSAPCSQHHCYSCASTAQVLGMTTKAEGTYSPVLDHMLTEMLALNDIIRVGEEIIQKAIAAERAENPPSSPAAGAAQAAAVRTRVLSGGRWYETDILSTVMKGNVQMLRTALKYIAGVTFPDKPVNVSTDPRCCPCQCLKNKQTRLSQSLAAISKMMALATEAGDQAKEEFDKVGKPSLLQIAGLIVHGLEAAEILFALELGPLGIPLAVLSGGSIGAEISQWATEPAVGGELLEFAYVAKWLGALKIQTMLAIIYHNQQAAAPTCNKDKINEKGDRDVGGGMFEKHGTGAPPQEERPAAPAGKHRQGPGE